MTLGALVVASMVNRTRPCSALLPMERSQSLTVPRRRSSIAVGIHWIFSICQFILKQMSMTVILVIIIYFTSSLFTISSYRNCMHGHFPTLISNLWTIVSWARMGGPFWKEKILEFRSKPIDITYTIKRIYVGINCTVLTGILAMDSLV
jgi:hypothetical protein